MNNVFFQKCGTCLLLGAAVGFLALSNVRAQETMPASKPPSPGAYSFKMRLNPETDVTAWVNAVPSQSTGSSADPKTAPVRPSSLTAHNTIVRAVRSDIVRESQSSGDGNPMVRYYLGEWCAFDDPRKGLNVRRTSMGGLFFPLGLYHFPELLWAEPKTQQPDPKMKEGPPQIRLYKDGENLLEVDAATQRPIRYLNGNTEWKYSYSDDPSPIVMPEKIETALSRVLPKRKR